MMIPISAVVSLTLVPMACAKLLRPETKAHEESIPALLPRRVRAGDLGTTDTR